MVNGDRIEVDGLKSWVEFLNQNENPKWYADLSTIEGSYSDVGDIILDAEGEDVAGRIDRAIKESMKFESAEAFFDYAMAIETEKINGLKDWIEFLNQNENPKWYADLSTIEGSYSDVGDIILDAEGEDVAGRIDRAFDESMKFESAEAFFEYAMAIEVVEEEPKVEEVVEEKPKTKKVVEEKPKVEEVVEEKPKTKKVIEIKKAPKVHEESSLNYTRFEKARIVGARALQISHGAPILVDYPLYMIDPIDIAELEYKAGIIPITVKRS